MSQQSQLRYKAFCNTNPLWKEGVVMDIEQLELPETFSPVFLRKLEKNRRLGQLAEQFVFNQIETSEHTELLAENIQIQKNKNTLGELDALLLFDGKPIHLEIIYKFYVYDNTLGCLELERWIGPNRNDSLIEKLVKLNKKQLPLLDSIDCKNTLDHINLDQYDFEQRVLFKAQLFVPFEKEAKFEYLNSDCVCGFYIHTEQLKEFTACTFYIPEKLDWFLEPNDTIEWLAYSNFRNNSDAFLKNNQSPLFWMKSETGVLTKGFLVWW